MAAGLKSQGLETTTEPRRIDDADLRTIRSQAIERRRIARKLSREIRDRKAERATPERRAWEAEAVHKMVMARIRRRLPVFAIQNSYAYWALRRFGYDMIRDDMRCIWWGGEFLVVPPEVSDAWLWWASLGQQTQDHLTAVKRRISVETVALTNPHFYVETKMAAVT